MVTRTLVSNCLNTAWADIPEEAVIHARKSILNWLGAAIGAARHPSVDMALSLGADLGSSPQVSILGRTEKADLLLGTLVNGMSSHIFDFDDTHLETIHHPSAPVAPVVFALGEKLKLPGDRLLRAFILGCEAELRICRAIHPSHYDAGWHITGTAGVFGAAIAAGILLGLKEQELVYAMGIAGTQASGLREMFGSMTKPFHPGKAAQNGLLAALLAQKGFTSSTRVLEAKRGFANVMAQEHNLELVNAAWGDSWEFRKNTFKPYACGIVLHPAIDACRALREKAGEGQVTAIELTVNPYVLELTGKQTPKTGLEGKFSIYHTAAIAFLEGDASEEQYGDDKVLDPGVIEFRQKIRPVASANMPEHQALARMVLRDGTVFEHKVENATGSLANPMGNEALQRKFRKLTTPVIGEEKANRVIELCKNLQNITGLAELLSYAT